MFDHKEGPRPILTAMIASWAGMIDEVVGPLVHIY